MNKSTSPFLDRLSQTPEGRRKVCRERMILQITELICEIMAEYKIKRSELAARMNCSPSEVSQFLDGTQNMTIGRLSDIFAALEHEFIPAARPKFQQVNDVSVTTYKLPTVHEFTATDVANGWGGFQKINCESVILTVKPRRQLVDSQ